MDKVEPMSKEEDTEGDASGAEKDGAEECEAGENIQELLSRDLNACSIQLAETRKLLNANRRRALRMVSKHAEVAAKLETENAELHLEIHGLREKLLAAGLTLEFNGRSETGGTGESLPTKSLQERWAFSCSSRGGFPQNGDTGSGTQCHPESGQAAASARPASSGGGVAIGSAAGVAPSAGSRLPPLDGPPATTGPSRPAGAMDLPGSVNNFVEWTEALSEQVRCDRLVLVESDVNCHSDMEQEGEFMSVVAPIPKAVATQIAVANSCAADEATKQAWLRGPKNMEERATFDSREELDDKKAGMMRQAVFADANAMKEKLRAAIGKPEYNVANFYHETGLWQKIARAPAFDHCTQAVIGLNALWIAVDTDNNEADVLIDAEPVFQIVENFFCFYFAFEWVCRFMSFKRKRDCARDAWFCFDTALVAIMVLETWVFTVLLLAGAGGSGGGVGNAGVLKLFRLVRLTRMARMARLLRAMPELMVMIKGMASAMRSVFFTLCLLACIVYVFAISFVQLMGPRGALEPTEVGNRLFKNVPVAMNNLLLGGTMPDQADLVNEVGGENSMMRLLILFYILLASLTVMNMLVGVLCEVVSVVSAVEKEQLLVNFVKSQLLQLLESIGFDPNSKDKIDKGSFDVLLAKPEAARTLQEVGVDVIGLVDLTDFIFRDCEGLSFPEFMDVVLQLRGSNTATVKDIVDLRKLVVGEIAKIKDERGLALPGS